MRLGPRGSVLARAQSTEVARAITANTGREVELVDIVTAGDRSSAPIAQLGVGVFVSALREALLAKEIDLAVHSYKDLPTAPADGLVVAAVPPRADPRDALIARGLTLTELPDDARIGTGSLRRAAQLHALGRRLQPVPVRGNVDTRLRKVADGQLDAVVVARAGLARLGRQNEISETLDPLLMLPAPAQGALAVECRADDLELVELLGALDDPASRVAVEAERALLADLQAGCSAPVAALAEVAEGDEGPEIYLRAAVLSLDGAFAIRLSRTATLTSEPRTSGPGSAAETGRLLAREMRAEGADTILGVPR
jgi:hydroxymethylbilane synthase